MSFSLLCSFYFTANVLTEADYVKSQVMKDGKKVSLSKTEVKKLQMPIKIQGIKLKSEKAQPPVMRDCVNDDSTADSWGDTCTSWYDDYPADCGTYDTADFIAAANNAVLVVEVSQMMMILKILLAKIEGLWDCGDGQCIYTNWVCDGSSEHGNGSWGPIVQMEQMKI